MALVRLNGERGGRIRRATVRSLAGLDLREADGGYSVANGPSFSPDDSFAYHTDTARRLVYRYQRRPNGVLADKHVLIRFEEAWGYPDGMTVDAEGFLWIAHWGGGRLSRFSPDGELDRSIPLPVSQVTSCCFAGPALDRMFVTTAAIGRENEPLAGSLFEVDPGVKGMPAGHFAG